MPTGPVCSGSKASRRLLWPSGTTPSLSMLQPWPGNPVWALVLGTEGDGLSEPVIQGCDYTVLIPMSHGVNSLNVAMASAVAFWQLGRR